MTEKVVSKKATKKVVSKTSSRKAPTRAPARSVSKENNTPILIFAAIFLVLIGISVAVGYSDKGAINVSNTISEKKRDATPEEQEKLKNVSAQQSKSNKPDGGLVPTTDIDKSVANKKTEETGTSTDATASSTDVTASSTDEVVEENQENESEETTAEEPAAEETTTE